MESHLSSFLTTVQMRNKNANARSLNMVQKIHYIFPRQLCDRACLTLLTFRYALYFFYCPFSSPPNADGALGSCRMLQGLCKQPMLLVPWLPGTVLLSWRRWNYKIGRRSGRGTRLRSISLRWRGSLNDTYSSSECVLQISELCLSACNLLLLYYFWKATTVDNNDQP